MKILLLALCIPLALTASQSSKDALQKPSEGEKKQSAAQQLEDLPPSPSVVNLIEAHKKAMTNFRSVKAQNKESSKPYKQAKEVALKTRAAIFTEIEAQIENFNTLWNEKYPYATQRKRFPKQAELNQVTADKDALDYAYEDKPL